ncbi:zinc-binding dehydrogenase [Streptomyces sp. GbtcB6]|uniref:zinc-dependent alcohol dehydrogenase n=1 Tax=Streptomyces sp. GbtcB6 TaxID=2824751 RepID=UPI001C2FC447|nr:alcohol dehydrogenase catalytic domain-containing protein [Streptomyces sp. GbtcB6]
MEAVVLGVDRKIVLESRPEPGLRPDQVIVEVDLCGICGSDLHAPQLPQVYRGGFVMGHEPSGRITRVGDEAGDWKVGQRIAVNPNGNVCGHCTYCLSGRPNFCRQATMETALGLQMDGALARRMAVFPGTLRALPASMGRLEAAWVEPTATALRAAVLAGGLGGATVAVFGGGPIGQLACRIAAHRGAGRVVLVEPAPERRRFGPASGADLTLSPAESGAELAESTVDVVFECSGNAAARAEALRLLTPGGVLVNVGAGPGGGFDPDVVLLKEITNRGSFVYGSEFDDAVGLHARGDIRVDDLTTEIVPVGEALRAIDALRSAEVMKVFVAPNG